MYGYTSSLLQIVTEKESKTLTIRPKVTQMDQRLLSGLAKTSNFDSKI